jgi:hypothetical protein
VRHSIPSLNVTAADPARAVERYPTTRHDHVDVWMMAHRGAPGVEYRGEADLDAEVLGIVRIVCEEALNKRS